MKSLLLVSSSLLFLPSEAFSTMGVPRHATFFAARAPVQVQQQQQQVAVVTTTTITTRHNMFGGLFGGGSDTTKKDLDAELALYPKLGFDNVKFDSLSDYILNWSKLFETDAKGMHLTTPVKVLPSNNAVVEEKDDDDSDDDVVDVSGVRLVFKSMETGYMSREEEDQARTSENSNNSNKKKKKKEKKQGGVEVLVEKLTSGEVRVRARRCDADEDTIIKEMSEEAIIDQLKRAIDVWKRETA